MPITIARPKPGLPFSSGQPLLEHCENVARLSGQFADYIDSKSFLQAAGMLHDLGKAADAWQRYLSASVEEPVHGATRKSAPVKHAAAGIAAAFDRYPKIYALILAYIIAGHHAGLPDGSQGIGGKDPAPGWTLDDWRKEGEKDFVTLDDAMRLIRDHLPDPSTLHIPRFLIDGNDEHRAQALPFWIRMLYSCLVDADCLDAEAVSNPVASSLRGHHATIPELFEKLNTHLATFPIPETGSVNEVRAEILAACRAAAKQLSGVFSLTVPTGGGKTLSGMAFALEHAVKHNKRRIIHVIPYTSIIEQTADVFSGIFGADNVCEHHSGIDTNEADEPTAARLATENWDAPIIVTTSVQFFESLYASRGSRCRKLHNLADSVIVLDEAQLVPVELLEPCIEALRLLVHSYGVTLVLSTATQPSFPKLNAREIIPDPSSLYSRLRRTRFVWPEHDAKTISTTTWPKLADELRAHESFLCVVNTRKDARDLWRELGGDAFHLSTLMCGQHRRDVLSTIRQQLNAKTPTKLVSTQLIEAGVDVDFPVVYRALAGMDSIAQTGGRCNREGKCTGLAEVHVFVPETSTPPGLVTKGKDIVAEFIRILPPEAFEKPDIFAEYFRRLYSVANGKGEDILRAMGKEAKQGVFPFRTIAQKFRLIEEDTIPVIVNYRNGKNLADQIRTDGLNWKLLRRAQRYMVSPARRIVEQLERSGRIEQIADGLYSPTALGAYDEKTGLDIWTDGISPDSLMV